MDLPFGGAKPKRLRKNRHFLQIFSFVFARVAEGNALYPCKKVRNRLRSANERRSVDFGHFLNNFRADLTHNFTVPDTWKIIRKNGFPVVYPVRTQNIFVQNVRFKAGRQFPAVHEFFTRLLYVLHQIPERMPHLIRRAERLKIIASVPFEEVGVLMRRLHTAVFGVIVPRFDDLSDHASGRDIEDTVEMQSSRFPAALPYADMLPSPCG